MLGMKAAAVMAMILLFTVGGFYVYYQDTQKRIATLVENNAKLEIAVQTNEEAISSLKTSIASANAELTRVNKAFAEARTQNRELTDRLAKHEIGMLAAKKPAMVEGIINKASDKALRCFEIMSGSPLTEQEKGAKDAKSFNSECPWLWTGVTP